MDTTTLHVSTTLDAAPAAVFTALTRSDLHSAFTGARSELDARPGGSFSYFDGAITGTFLEVEEGRRTVQELHAGMWPEGHFARVTTELEPLDGGGRTLVKVAEQGVPAAEIDAVMAGWSQYWTGLSTFLREQREEEAGERAYLLAQVIVRDPEGFHPYIERTSKLIVEMGGEVLDVVRAEEVLEGEWPEGALTALVRFPDADSARSFWNSGENDEMKELRQRTATSHVALCLSIRP